MQSSCLDVFIWNYMKILNPFSANPTKWSNTQTIRRQQPANCFSVFDHFVGLVFKGLTHFRLMFTVYTTQKISVNLNEYRNVVLAWNGLERKTFSGNTNIFQEFFLFRQLLKNEFARHKLQNLLVFWKSCFLKLSKAPSWHFCKSKHK